MNALRCLWTALALTSAPAQAASIAVMADSDEHALNDAAVESILWHALHAKLGHDALFVEGELPEVHGALKAAHLTTLLRFHVSWSTDLVEVDGGILMDQVPTVHVEEYRTGPQEMALVRTWDAHGALALYRVSETTSLGYLAMPEVSLQETIFTALGPVQPPVWRTQPTGVVTMPIEVCADDEYRAFYGERWKAEVDKRVQRASDLLAPAGLALRVSGHCDWESDLKDQSLKLLLEHLAEQPLRDGLLRVGFTQQMHLESGEATRIEDVGRAFQPGRDLVIADQALPPGHQPIWDEAEEAVAVAHEVLHTLGLPHLESDQFLMSALKRSTIHRLSPSSAALARAAAEARYAHWDPELAMLGLAHAAQAWITEPDLQVEYIRENLARGPGVPVPGDIAPNRISALANVAISRHWLLQASTSPSDSALRKTVLAHTNAALLTLPELAQPMIEALAQLEVKPEIIGAPCLPGHSDGEPGACLTR